ncbi:MAG: P-loop NTPase [Candidatus Micrarchaeia archaeon]
MARVIGIVSGKGGVGKTTLVVNLGASLASIYGKKVTIVDLNLTTSHLGSCLGMHYCPANIAKVLRGEAPLEDALFTHEPSKMRVLPGSMRLSDLQGIDFAKLKPLLKTVSNWNDFVLVDAGPGLGIEAVAALKYSEELLYVTTPFVPAVMDIVRCEEVARQFSAKTIGIVSNMADEEEHQLSPREITQLTGLEVISQIPRDSAVSKSLAAETPLVLYDRHAPAAQAMIALAAKIAGLPSEATEPGIFHKISRHLKKAARNALR